uniref:Uncharacterized protein n=1 Tax=Acrobeloides nanus TaxID=290746 RepID=A0A914DS62_9BILA
MSGLHHQRRVATEPTGFEPVGLRSVEHFGEESMCYASPNLETLKRALVKAWDEISVETLKKIMDDFPKRLKACVEADGGHFE